MIKVSRTRIFRFSFANCEDPQQFAGGLQKLAIRYVNGLGTAIAHVSSGINKWIETIHRSGQIKNKERELEMANKPKVKVIKKGDVKPAAKPVENENRSKRQAARDMVANVTGWVSDLQTRKREETRLAFEQLFKANPRPSEM